MGRAYKDDAQFHKIKIDLNSGKSSGSESFSAGLIRLKEEEAERETCGASVHIFKQRIIKKLCKTLKVDITSKYLNNLVDKFPNQIQKMFDEKISPDVAAKKLIEHHESGSVGFTFYISNPELLNNK